MAFHARKQSLFTLIVVTVVAVTVSIGVFTMPVAAGAEEPTVTATFNQSEDDPSKVTVTVHYDVPTNNDNFYVYMTKTDAITVLSKTGFEKQQYPENKNLIRYKLSTTNKPSITYRIDVTKQTQGPSFLSFGSEKNWAFGHTPYMQMVWYNHQTEEWEHDDSLNDNQEVVTINKEDPGFIGNSVFYLGPYETRTTQSAGQTFRLLIPKATTIPAGADSVLHSLTVAASEYTIGNRDSTVTVLAKPGDGGGGFTYYGSGETVVHHDAKTTTPRNVWIHEYIHTRQQYQTTTEMKWIREASAEYHTAKITYSAGLTSLDDASERATEVESGNHDTLSKPSKWADSSTPYEKGAAVLAALDAKILRVTDGEKSLEDVIRRLNSKNSGKITYDEFRNTVNTVSGKNMNAWLRKYIRTDAPAPDANWESAMTTYVEQENTKTEETTPKPESVLTPETASVFKQSDFWSVWAPTTQLTTKNSV